MFGEAELFGTAELFGSVYPDPIVDLRETRAAALAAYSEMRDVGLCEGDR